MVRDLSLLTGQNQAILKHKGPWFDINEPQVVFFQGKRKAGKGVGVDELVYDMHHAGITTLHLWAARNNENWYYALVKGCKAFWDNWREEHRVQLENDEIEEPLHCNCFDKETEVLTDKGFKFFNELDKSEKILSLDPITKNLEYLKPVDYIKYKHDGEMIQFKNKWLDLLVTKDHNMLIENTNSRKKQLGKFELIPASKVKKSHRIYKTSEWKGTDKKFIIIDDIKIKTDTFCKFMGYYLSEGSTYKRKTRKNSYHISIGQFKNNNLNKICDDLKDFPFKINRYENSIVISNSKLGKYLHGFGKSYEKFIPEEIKELTPEYIRIFLDAYCLGDGTIYKPKNYKKGNFKEQQRYFTSSKKLADDICELIIKVGKSASYYLMKNKGKSCKFKNGTYNINHDIWRVNENTSKYANLDKNPIKHVPYNDYVYCVELPKYHTLFVRRNGKCVWSGNCSKPIPISVMIQKEVAAQLNMDEIDRFNGEFWDSREEYENAWNNGEISDYIPNEPWSDVTQIRKPLHLRGKTRPFYPLIKIKPFTVPKPKNKSSQDTFWREFVDLVLEARIERRIVVMNPMMFIGVSKFQTVGYILNNIYKLTQKHFPPLEPEDVGKETRSQMTVVEKSWHKIAIVLGEIKTLSPSSKMNPEQGAGDSKRALYNMIGEARHWQCWLISDYQSPEDLFVGVKYQSDVFVIKRATEKLLGDDWKHLFFDIAKKRQEIFDAMGGMNPKSLYVANRDWPEINHLPDNKGYVVIDDEINRLETFVGGTWHHKHTREQFTKDFGINIPDQLLSDIELDDEKDEKSEKKSQTKVKSERQMKIDLYPDINIEMEKPDMTYEKAKKNLMQKFVDHDDLLKVIKKWNHEAMGKAYKRWKEKQPVAKTSNAS